MTISLVAAGFPPFADDPACACKAADWRVFFPDHAGHGGAREALAKSFCAVCPVLARCREWSLPIRDLHGVWGSLSAADRANARRRAARKGTADGS